MVELGRSGQFSLACLRKSEQKWETSTIKRENPTLISFLRNQDLGVYLCWSCFEYPELGTQSVHGVQTPVQDVQVNAQLLRRLRLSRLVSGWKVSLVVVPLKAVFRVPWQKWTCGQK